MKKSLFSFSMIALTLFAVFTSCKNDEPDDHNKVVATIKQADLTEAVKAMYADWESTQTLPKSLNVGGVTLTEAQYQYAMFCLLPNLVSSDKSDIKVIECKLAANPSADSYDKGMIALKDGPANGKETEDLVNLCKRSITATKAQAQIPNNTIYYRNDIPVAFSTDRAIVCIARAVANGLPATVSTGYLSSIPSIRAFAQEYVKILDIWEANTGCFIYNDDLKIIPCSKEEAQKDASGVVDGHFIPEGTTITVGNITYSLADMWEVAMRSFLLLRGYDGNDISSVGYGEFAKTETQATMDSDVPLTHEYYFGNGCYNELPSAGGHLKMKGEYGKIKINILDNYTMRALNYNDGHCIANMCGYPKEGFEEYSGSFSSMRGLYTMAVIFKYMLDNNLSDATNISPDIEFRSELFGVGEEKPSPEIVGSGTIKEFMVEYTKLLLVWNANIGNFKYDYTNAALIPCTMEEAKAINEVDKGFGIVNGHYIPEDTKITVDGQEYNLADTWELALRCFLLLRGYDGHNTSAVGAAQFTKTTAQTTIDDKVPSTHGYYYGEGCYNELPASGGHLLLNGKTGNVKVDVLENFAMRALNFNEGHSIANMCGYPRTGVENYSGSFSAKRALITFAFFFRYMLDNNLKDATSISNDIYFHSHLFGNEEELEDNVK